MRRDERDSAIFNSVKMRFGVDGDQLASDRDHREIHGKPSTRVLGLPQGLHMIIFR
jgi:hypothetical protein